MVIRVQLESAFVVHRRAYRETSVLLDLFTEQHGRVALVARGVRRPKSPGRLLLQPFVPLLVSWTAKGELGNLTGCEAQGVASLPVGKALFSAFYVNELITRLLTRGDPHPDLFGHYAEVIRALAQPLSLSDPSPAIESHLRLFEKRLLDSVGYGLVFFDEDGDDLDLDTPKLFRYFRELGPRPFTDHTANGDGVSVSGQTLLKLSQEAPLDAEQLAEAKRLMRYLLQPLIGDKPLASRRLFTGQ